MFLEASFFTADLFLTVAFMMTLLVSVPPPITLSDGQLLTYLPHLSIFSPDPFLLLFSITFYSLIFATGKEDILGNHDAPVRCVEYSYAAGTFLTLFNTLVSTYTFNLSIIIF